MSEQELRVSTVDPIEAALESQQADPSTPEAVEPDAPSSDHPTLARFGGDTQKALDAFQELQNTYGRDGHRLGEENAQLRQQLDQIQQAQQQQPDESDLPDLGVDQLQQWMEEDQVQATAYMQAQSNRLLAQQFQEMLDKRLAPVETNVGQQMMTQMVEGLNKSLGADVVERNAQTLLDLKRDDPDSFKGDPKLVFKRMKKEILAAEHERAPRGASQDGGAATSKGVAVEGGSNGRGPQSNEQPSEIEAFLKAMEAPTEPKKGVFGTPQRRG